MSEHAFLSPSGAHAWRHCAMWPTMAQRYPDTSSEASEEGTAAHWVAMQALVGAPVAEGAAAPNGVIVTDEMLDGANIFALAVGTPQSEHHIEQRLRGARIHPSRNWGTPDYWDVGATARGSLLRIIDYKFGHEYVEEIDNWQLINYASLALDKLGIGGVADQMLTVELTIVQPRAYGHAAVRTWRPGTAADLRSHINILRAAAGRATEADPVASVGPHCKYCPGRHACVMLQRAAMHAVDHSGHAAPLDMPADALGHELRALDRAAELLEARRTGLQAQAVARLRAGERVPYYAMESSRGREHWTVPAAQVIALGAALGVDLSKPTTLTPAQARKAGAPADVVGAISARAPGEMRLVRDNGAAARKAFGDTLGQD